MKAAQLKEVLHKIKKQMTKAPGLENMRILVSSHLTKVLMLFGRLNLDYNPRYLPVTVNSIMLLINELEMMEKNSAEFSEILSENINRRVMHSNVFMIPVALKDNPDTKGLREATRELAAPLVKSYCIEEVMFLTTLSEPISPKTRSALFSRAKRNCEILRDLCNDEDVQDIEDLKDLCCKEISASEPE